MSLYGSNSRSSNANSLNLKGSSDAHVCPRAFRHWNKFDNSPSSLDAESNILLVKEKTLSQTVTVRDITCTNIKKCKRVVASPHQELIKLRKESLHIEQDHFSESRAVISTQHTYIFEDQKLVLRGFQTIQLMDKLLSSSQEDIISLTDLEIHLILPSLTHHASNESRKITSGDIQKIAFLRDKLKHQLDNRCFIGLRKECAIHIRLLKQFVEELKLLSQDEMSKLKSRLKSSFSVNKKMGEIYFGRKQKLFNHLVEHAGRWATILHKVNRMVAVFHIHWDARFRILLIHVEKTMERLINKAFNWTRAILVTDLVHMCLLDQQNLPSEIVQNLYLSLESFNNIVSDQEVTINATKDTIGCSCAGFLCFSSVMNFAWVLEFLAKSQAISASSHLLDSLTAEWKTVDSGGMSNNIQWLSQISTNASDQTNRNIQSTSDYYTCSASGSEVGTLTMIESTSVASTPLPLASTFAETLTKVTEIGQTSLLKHLFAMACMNSQPANVLFGNLKRAKRRAKISRSLWTVGKSRSGTESSSHLERIYWHHFWDTLERQSLMQAYYCNGRMPENQKLGSFFFASGSLPAFVLARTRQSVVVADLVEACTFVDNFSKKLFIESCQHSWDEKTCASLSVLSNHRIMTIPLLEGIVGTTVGKSLCDILGTVLAMVVMSQLLGCESLSNGTNWHTNT